MEQQLKKQLGDLYKPWHLWEVKRILHDGIYTEAEAVQSVVKAIKRRAALRRVSE